MAAELGHAAPSAWPSMCSTWLAAVQANPARPATSEGPLSESIQRFRVIMCVHARFDFCCKDFLMCLMLWVYWLGCSDAVGRGAEAV